MIRAMVAVMRLTDYLQELDNDRLFAKAINVSQGRVSRWRRGKSEPSRDEAWLIDHITKRKVRFQDCFEKPPGLELCR